MRKLASDLEKNTTVRLVVIPGAGHFFDDSLDDFFAPPLDLDFDALFFAALPPPLRAPLDFLLPFLAAIRFAPFVVLSLVQRNKKNNDCPRSFFHAKAQSSKERRREKIRLDLCGFCFVPCAFA